MCAHTRRVGRRIRKRLKKQTEGHDDISMHLIMTQSAAGSKQAKKKTIHLYFTNENITTRHDTTEAWPIFLYFETIMGKGGDKAEEQRRTWVGERSNEVEWGWEGVRYKSEGTDTRLRKGKHRPRTEQ